MPPGARLHRSGLTSASGTHEKGEADLRVHNAGSKADRTDVSLFSHELSVQIAAIFLRDYANDDDNYGCKEKSDNLRNGEILYVIIPDRVSTRRISNIADCARERE